MQIVGLGALVVIGAIFLVGKMEPTAAPTSSTNPALSDLPGLQTGNFPWKAEIDYLKERLDKIGLPALAEEGTVLHIHQHLDIWINGQKVSIPEIGDNTSQKFIAPIHTHDETGIIHVESPVVQRFTLGQFFDIWGVRLTDQCLGGYCAGDGSKLRLYENGVSIDKAFRDLELKPKAELVLVFGKENEGSGQVPDKYNFPAGY